MQFRRWKNQEIKKYLLSIYKIELPHVKHKTKTKVSQINLEVFLQRLKILNKIGEDRKTFGSCCCANFDY